MLASCAGREAQRVSVVQDSDFNKSCDALHLESNSNDSQIKALIVENANKQGKNAAVAIVGAVIFLPALFALDLKGAAKAEYEALVERNKHLADVAKNKKCKPIAVKTLEQYKKEVADEKLVENGQTINRHPNSPN